MLALALVASIFLTSGALASRAAPAALVTLSIVATTDVHGFVFPSNEQGGLALLGGYVNALRAVRASDGGAVLLVDAGDTFQGGVESDLSEGALVVDAYNALGYTAAAVGNHEFDFGAVDLEGAREGHTDPRGAIKALARRARFPFLTANLIDDTTGRAVDWPNVRPSVMVAAAGLNVGVVGAMTIGALRATLPANVHGLRVAPLAPAITAEASKLRAAGADVVVVVAHAGGRCARFDDPADLSSCDPDSEIFRLARALPPGAVDVIAGGHTHDAVAHQVDGIGIVQAYSRGQAFARADVVVNRTTRAVTAVHVLPPHPVCAHGAPDRSGCQRQDGSPALVAAAHYEGRTVAPQSAIVAAMAPALRRVRDLQASPLHVVLDTPIPRDGGGESPLGNLFADALREGAGADVAVTNNRIGGLRADLDAGPLTFGPLYDVFPFDNRVVRLRLSGADVTRVLTNEIARRRPGTLAISGLHVRASCAAGRVGVELYRPAGPRVRDDEQLIVATVDSLAAGAVFSAVAEPGRVVAADDGPLFREVVERWFRIRHGGHLRSDQFADPDHPRWEYPDRLPSGCSGV